MRAAGNGGHGGECPTRQNDGVGVGGRKLVHDLLDGGDGPPGREHGLLLHADDALQKNIAGAVRLLRVNDGDVGAEGGDAGEFLAGERARR